VCRASAPAIDGGRSVPALATPSGTIAPPPDAPCAAAGADAAGAVVPSEGEPAPGSVFAGKDGTAPADASVGVRSCEEAEGAAAGRRARAEGASRRSPVGRLDDGPKIAVAVPVLDQRDRASGKEDPHVASRDQPLGGSAPARPEARARVHRAIDRAPREALT